MPRLLVAFLFLLFAAPAAAQTFNGQEQAEIRAIVRDYLVRNPDVLQEALEALQERSNAERWQRAKSDPRDFSIGPADAPVTIVEFFDYRCPYCMASLEWVVDVVRTRRDVRFVFKELPLDIHGEPAIEASRASIAAMPQGRYFQFHQALLNYSGDLTSERIDQLARQSGIDVARMRRAMASEAITDILQDNRGLAVDLGVNGTPAFFINGEMVAGYNRPLLEEKLREATRNAQRGRRS
ncbi:MAG: thioredoxin domain-containing protein [Hyphomonadaceae bacterium]|nr:thioredoxin domain-containing protein [Hyphomonadaceae bacterium]